MTTVFEGFDLSDFWSDSAFDREHYVDAPFTGALVREVEQELGYLLPESYLAVMRVQNGGTPKRTCIPTTVPTSWAPDHVDISNLMGIGRGKRTSILHGSGSRYLQGEWGYPDVGILIGMTPSGGHEAIMLDYRECGPRGEPSVIYFDTDADDDDPRQLVVLAPDFETFVRNLVDVSAYDGSAEELEKALIEIQEAPFSPALAELVAASATPKETEASLRNLLHAIATEKRVFALDDGPGSRLVYDSLFMLYTDAHSVTSAQRFLDAFPSLLAHAEGLSVPSRLFLFIDDWMISRLQGGEFIFTARRLGLSDAHRRSVLRALASYA